MPIQFKEEKTNKQIAVLRIKEEEESVQRLSQKTNIPYVDLSNITIETDALALIEKEQAEKLGAAGFKLVGKDLYVAIRSPEKPGIREELFRLQNAGYTVGVYLTSQLSLEKAWSRYGDISITSKSRSSFLDISPASLAEVSKRAKKNEDIKEMINEAADGNHIKRVTKIIEIILGSSISTGSSDVHIEPQEEQTLIRFRQDGVLRDITNIDHATAHKINSRIKILSKLKLTQDQQAQDGRFTIEFNDQEIEVRTSIVPGAYGESIVMRILNPDIIAIEMKSLGIEPALFDILRREVHKPNGLILTTGPTGSGKTTTLYAFIKEIYNPEIKILTIEDPIEYHLKGITQTQVNKSKGYTFLSGLRGALRQDPDAIMVGEIRDSETAEIAVNASLTGHIVLSTLHTNNAAGAIPRMLDLGINAKVLPSALTLSIAQRLVRKLVPECSEQYVPDEKLKKLIRRILKNAERTGKDLSSYGVRADQEIILYRPKKETCTIGNGTGYKGRIGLFEAILMDEELENLIAENPSEREIRRIANKQGILTMQEDGVLKALSGVTSIEEIQKAVDLTENLDDELEEPIIEVEEAIEEKPITAQIDESEKPETITEVVPQPEIQSNAPFDELPGFIIPAPDTKEDLPPKNESIIENKMQETPNQELENRMANIENSLGRLASLMEKTTEHLVSSQPTRTPSPIAPLRKIRKAEREHHEEVSQLREQLDNHYPDEDQTADAIADSIRDLEILMLLERIETLENEQKERPSKNITEQIRSARKTIVAVIKANPPSNPDKIIDGQSRVLKDELNVILDRLFELEKNQTMDSSQSAADDLATARKQIDEVLTSA